MPYPDGAAPIEAFACAPRAFGRLISWIVVGFVVETTLFLIAPNLWWDLPRSLKLALAESNPQWGDWPWSAFKLTVISAAGWAVLFGKELVTLATRHARRPSKGVVLLHLLCLLLLLASRSKIHSEGTLVFWGSALSVTIVLASSAGFFLTLIRLTSTETFWAKHHPLRHPTAAVFLGTILAFSLMDWNLSLMSGLATTFNDQLFAATMALAMPVLHSAGYNAIANSASHIVSIGDFAVQIAPVCLGYEGWGIAFVLIGGYLLINRRTLLFPHCLTIFPIVAIVLFVCNSLRVAALLAIGASGHVDVAVNGFHSTAGSITLFIVIFAAFILLSYIRPRSTARAPFEFDLTGSNRQLLPWLAVTALTIAFGLVSAGVDWWYPARVLIVGGLLYRWRGQLGLDSPSSWWLGPVAGVAVFVTWLALVPHDAVQSAIFEEKLFSSSVAATWIVFRVLGASVIVPVVEELAFRGFLLDRVAQIFEERGWSRNAAVWAGVAASAVVFGLLHSAWVVGILAGVCYAAVRLYRGRLADAVIAHAVTNLLLSAYVLNTGSWSYW